MQGEPSLFATRMSHLFEEHCRKFSLLERFRKANLYG